MTRRCVPLVIQSSNLGIFVLQRSWSWLWRPWCREWENRPRAWLTTHDKVALKKKSPLQKRSCLSSGPVMKGSSQAGFMHIHGSGRQSAHIQKPVPGIWESKGFISILLAEIVIFLLKAISFGYQLGMCVGARKWIQGKYPIIFPWHSPYVYPTNKIPSFTKWAPITGTAWRTS